MLVPSCTPGSAVVSLLVEPDRGPYYSIGSIVGPLHAPPAYKMMYYSTLVENLVRLSLPFNSVESSHCNPGREKNEIDPCSQ